MGNDICAMHLASLRAREKKWLFWGFWNCCSNVGDLGIKRVNMSGPCSVVLVVVGIIGWPLLLSQKVLEVVDDNGHMAWIGQFFLHAYTDREREGACFCVSHKILLGVLICTLQRVCSERGIFKKGEGEDFVTLFVPYRL